jgi:hypothetical protein
MGRVDKSRGKGTDKGLHSPTPAHLPTPAHPAKPAPTGPTKTAHLPAAQAVQPGAPARDTSAAKADFTHVAAIKKVDPLVQNAKDLAAKAQDLITHAAAVERLTERLDPALKKAALAATLDGKATKADFRDLMHQAHTPLDFQILGKLATMLVDSAFGRIVELIGLATTPAVRGKLANLFGKNLGNDHKMLHDAIAAARSPDDFGAIASAARYRLPKEPLLGDAIAALADPLSPGMTALLVPLLTDAKHNSRELREALGGAKNLPDLKALLAAAKLRGEAPFAKRLQTALEDIAAGEAFDHELAQTQRDLSAIMGKPPGKETHLVADPAPRPPEIEKHFKPHPSKTGKAPAVATWPAAPPVAEAPPPVPPAEPPVVAAPAAPITTPPAPPEPPPAPVPPEAISAPAMDPMPHEGGKPKAFTPLPPDTGDPEWVGGPPLTSDPALIGGSPVASDPALTGSSPVTSDPALTGGSSVTSDPATIGGSPTLSAPPAGEPAATPVGPLIETIPFIRTGSDGEAVAPALTAEPAGPALTAEPAAPPAPD